MRIRIENHFNLTPLLFKSTVLARKLLDLPCLRPGIEPLGVAFGTGGVICLYEYFHDVTPDHFPCQGPELPARRNNRDNGHYSLLCKEPGDLRVAPDVLGPIIV